MISKERVESRRWEFCPYCGSGFTNYIGRSEKSDKHEYECSHEDCEAYFVVPDGQGEWDKRLGMQYSEEVLYYLKCDFCSKKRACRVSGLRISCKNCEHKL